MKRATTMQSLLKGKSQKDFLIFLPCCLSSTVLHAMDDPEKNQANQ